VHDKRGHARSALPDRRGPVPIIVACAWRAIRVASHLAAVNENGGGSLGVPAVEDCPLARAPSTPGMLRCMPYLSGPQKAQPEGCSTLVPTGRLRMSAHRNLATSPWLAVLSRGGGDDVVLASGDGREVWTSCARGDRDKVLGRGNRFLTTRVYD